MGARSALKAGQCQLWTCISNIHTQGNRTEIEVAWVDLQLGLYFLLLPCKHVWSHSTQWWHQIKRSTKKIKMCFNIWKATITNSKMIFFFSCLCVCKQSIVYKSKGKSNFQAQHTRMGPNIINVTMEWSSPCPLLCWVRRQMRVLWRARQGSQDNGQGLHHFHYSKILGGRINDKKKREQTNHV
jgi:hypothetical protein